jgi:hypothetical protein
MIRFLFLSYYLLSTTAIVPHENVARRLRFSSTTVDTLCSDNSIPAQNFTVTIRLTPPANEHFDSYSCPDGHDEKLGLMMNGLLLEYGVGSSNTGDAEYLAEICTTPQTDKSRLRRMLLGVFIYRGGGACRLCAGDNTDGRSLYSSRRWGGTGSFGRGSYRGDRHDEGYRHKWFNESFQPNFCTKIEDAIKADILPNQSCVPEDSNVYVEITEVTGALEITCPGSPKPQYWGW